MKLYYGILCVALLSSGVATASPTVIEDERVRSLSVTPVLGRGYSLLTNTFHSICLNTEAPTESTYNYDCKFTKPNINFKIFSR